MAPIHDTDVAKERWEKDEWKTFELWEKVEAREHKKRQRWIIATIIAFILLSSVPVLMDRWPKWQSLSAARKLAVQLEKIKLQTALNHASYRLKITNFETLEFEVNKTTRCDDSLGELVYQGKLNESIEGSPSVLVKPEDASRFNLNTTASEVCYDFITGFSSGDSKNEFKTAFAFIPVKDLTESRWDRASVLLIKGDSAKMTFH